VPLVGVVFRKSGSADDLFRNARKTTFAHGGGDLKLTSFINI
jgi:hypothetical protein